MACPPAEKVLLVGWGAAEWNVIRPLLDRGAMPHLRRLIDGGASGVLVAPQPLVPPMLSTSAATGKRPHKHGIHGYAEPRPDGDGVRAASSTARTAKALWNILTQNQRPTCCVNWPVSHPAEPIDGLFISDRFALPPRAPAGRWPLPPGSVHPPELAEVLAELRLRPEEIDASMLLPLVPNAARVDQSRDKRLLACAAILAETASVHAAATRCLQHHPWDVAAVAYDGLRQFSHYFMDYHPPKQAHVSDEDIELYGGVVGAAYRFHDMMLGRLLQLAGGRATVLLFSDHGYHTGARRPRGAPPGVPASPGSRLAAYRPQGVCVLSGPGVARGAALHAARLLDVTPTVLTLLGIPVGADMDGRPWVEALDAPVEVDRVMSWDAVPGDAGMHPPEARVTYAESLDAVRHLIDLGYADPNDEATRRAVDRTVDDNRFNLARSLLDADQVDRAIAVLETLVRDRSDHMAYGRALFEAYYLAGRNAECRRMAEAAWTRGDRGPVVHLALGAVEMAHRHAEAALRHFMEAEAADANLPGLHVLIGRAYLRLRQWDAAARAFTRATEADPENEAAWHGLASAALGQGRFEQAADSARRAIALRDDYPEAYYHLGLALSRLGRPNEAAAALHRALALDGSLLAAYGRLVELYDGPLADPARARQLRRDADQTRLRRRLRRRGAAAPD